MRSLSDTISRLAAMRARSGVAQNDETAGRLLDFAWRGANPGALKAKTYVPGGLPDGAPLVVVLHGCTQTAAGYDLGSGWSTLADQAGFALLFPEQQRTNNANLCFNWFLPEDTRRGAGEALSIREMIEAFVAEHGIDRRRIFITGLSAGGAMTSAMLATYPEVFAGGAIIAGLPFGVASTVPEAFDRMRGHGGPSTADLHKLLRSASPHNGPWPILSVWHGSADQTVAASNMEAIVDQWRVLHGVGRASEPSEMVDGHTRRVWRDNAGRDVIETYSIAGMGHGTPLSAMGDGGYGASGPFMLDVGISSTLRIAQFWGIARGNASSEQDDTKVSSSALAVSSQALHSAASRVSPQPRRLEDVRIMRAADASAGSNVQRVIEDALRAAGLMK